MGGLNRTRNYGNPMFAKCPVCEKQVKEYKPKRWCVTMGFKCECGCEFRVDMFSLARYKKAMF